MAKLRVCLLLSLLFVLLSTVGVSAAWMYYGFATAVEEPIVFEMGAWKPNIVLPGEEENDDGTNHLAMIEQILNNSHAGLNPKPKVLLDAIHDTRKNPFGAQGLFYSQQDHITGGNLKFLLEDNIVNLHFVIETVREQQSYYVYTYVAQSDSQDGELITAYKTLVEKSGGRWVAAWTNQGVAPVKNFEVGSRIFYAIDHTLWENV